jgi:hypothetical protein
MEAYDAQFWRNKAADYELLYQGQKEVADKYKNMYLELLEEKQKIENELVKANYGKPPPHM